jgi:hypothetical protein
MERETELMLVGRLRDGDTAAFDAVYEAYRARLYTFLARLSRSRAVATPTDELHTAAKIAASVSGRISASFCSVGRMA